MVVVGLTGGIASGKSVISNMLRDLGAVIIDADEISREVMFPHSRCWEEVVAAYGSECLLDDLTIDRKKLAMIVFGDSKRIQQLNRIVHPYIKKRIDEIIDDMKGRYPHALLIVDAALLVETGLYKHYDKLIVVSASRDTQVKRLISRDGVSREEAEGRVDCQLPLSEKLKVADYIIENEGSFDNTREEVEKVYQVLTR